MRSCRVSCIAIILLSGAAANGKAATALEKFIVTGKILDPQSNPVKGAKIRVFESHKALGRPVGLSDEKGKFSLTLENLNLGRDYLLTASHTKGNLAGKVMIFGNKNRQDVTVRLLPAATVSGKLLGEDKKPRAGVKIQLWLFAPEPGGRASSYNLAIIGKSAKTDMDGHFIFENLVPGVMYRFRAVPVKYVPAIVGELVPKPGRKKGLADFILTKADQSIAGVVVDAGGKPLTGIHVIADTRGQGKLDDSKSAATDKKGRFRIDGLPKGKLRIQAQMYKVVNVNAKLSAYDIVATAVLHAEGGNQSLRIVMPKPKE